MADDDRQQIGTVQMKIHGYTARCTLDRCGWFKEGIRRQDEAKMALRAHADVAHPPVIRVFR